MNRLIRAKLALEKKTLIAQVGSTEINSADAKTLTSAKDEVNLIKSIDHGSNSQSISDETTLSSSVPDAPASMEIDEPKENDAGGEILNKKKASQFKGKTT